MILLSGCRLQTIAPPEEEAAAAIGLAGAIVFREQPMPVEEDDATPELLSFPEALRLTLKNDPGIQAALGRVRIAQADADQARLLPNPILSVAFRIPDSGGRAVVEAGLAEDLLSVLRRPGLVSAADDRLRAAGAEAVSAVLDAVSSLGERFVAAQALDSLCSELEERKRLNARLIELARARLELGEGTLLDLTTAEAQRLEIESEIAERQLERREERLALARLIGQPGGAADWRLPAWDPPNPITVPDRRWAEAALVRRPEVQAKEWQLAALGAERRLAWLAPLEGAGVGVDAEREEEWSVGPSIALPLPIFDFGQARRARARAAVLEASHELTGIKRLVVEEIRRAHEAYAATLANLARVERELMPLAERRLGQAQFQFKTGETDITELLLAEQDLHEAHTRLIELQRKASVALIRLERAVGGAGVAAELEAAAQTKPGVAAGGLGTTPEAHGEASEESER
ncbi:TolC family protein [Tautonia sociabilis]|uniref:TolC family protein n=1 Tax=Tautonia sociabilis TaxID=2080755 RepID=UPI0013159B7A|nr:TolC family protein [Tautonia sociabilis]